MPVDNRERESVQFNVVPDEWVLHDEERAGASDEEKKFLMGRVTADRNRAAQDPTVSDQMEGIPQKR
jgi:hypothetical protein